MPGQSALLELTMSPVLVPWNCPLIEGHLPKFILVRIC
jgi:hypothetical protein